VKYFGADELQRTRPGTGDGPANYPARFHEWGSHDGGRLPASE
jgi:hypothetical protein